MPVHGRHAWLTFYPSDCTSRRTRLSDRPVDWDFHRIRRIYRRPKHHSWRKQEYKTKVMTHQCVTLPMIALLGHKKQLIEALSIRQKITQTNESSTAHGTAAYSLEHRRRVHLENQNGHLGLWLRAVKSYDSPSGQISLCQCWPAEMDISDQQL